MNDPIRLQRAIAEAGIASRRGAEALIGAGRVTVDGRPARVGERVDPARQRIEIDGRPMPAAQRLVYLAISKPVGITTTVRDRHARRTVLELIPAELRGDARLYPVGRLDRDSEGLLVLTNDGALAQRLLHPRYAVEREYAVALRGPLTHGQEAQLREGIELEEGRAKIRGLRRATPAETAAMADQVWPPAELHLTWYRVILTQGRKRQLRRMFGAVGAPIERLIRVRIGPLGLQGLAAGTVRSLREAEVDALRASASEAASAAERGGPAQGAPGSPYPLVVALDGPGSSGKSTVGSAAADYLGYRFCDTGMLYRAVTWLAIAKAIPPDAAERLSALVAEVELGPDAEGRLSRVLVDGRDVTAEVGSAQVDRRVSEVARRPEVRAALLPRQRALAAGGRIVMAGRDIGTVVLPEADLKLYLDASVEERARRRAEQRSLEPDSPGAARILAELRRRDRIDATRPVAPLRLAPDAVVIRTDGNTLGQTIDEVVAAIRRRERELTRSRRSPARGGSARKEP